MTRMLVPLFGKEEIDSVVLGAASKLAKSGGALIDARLFCRDLAAVVPFAGEGLTPEVMEQLRQSAKAEHDLQEKNARSSFNVWCVHDEVPLGDVAAQGSLAANFAVCQGHLPSIIVKPARVSDMALFVCATNNEDDERQALAEAVLVDALRPLLLLPAKPVSTIARNIVIAWNGSAEAARAVSMSQALLKAADKVTIVTVGDETDPRTLAVTLQSNGIVAVPHVVTAGKTDISQALLIQAEKFDADLMIIGAYSHSRMREVIFGGVTRELFENTSIPTLMIH
ncbi:MAG: universal stress protein [Rhodospirillales bacterium]